MVFSSKTSEKRRYKRQGTKVDAVMAIGDKTTIQCIILDFCEQGLFLHLKDPAIVGLQKGKSAKIYFSAQIDAYKEYFQIDAQIARISGDGIGVVFENITKPMYEALTASTNLGSIAAYSSNPKFYLTSSNQDQFKNACRDMLNTNLPVFLKEFFEDVEGELEKPHSFTSNFKDVAAQRNLTGLLRMNKNTLIANYCRALTTQIEFTGDTAEQRKGSDIPGSKLSLVEKDEFEDWLSFSTMIRKTNAQYKNLLYQLELKLSYVTCFPRFLIKNPIDPEHLCETFRTEIAGIEDSVAAKRALYLAFQETLLEHLSTLYRSFDALLVEFGAPAGIAQDIVWKKNYPTGPKPDAYTETFTPDGHQLPTFDNDAYHYSDSSYNPALQSPSVPLPRPLRAGNQNVSQTASKLFKLINQGLGANLGSEPSLSHEIERDGYSDFGGAEYSSDELLSALTKLQASKALKAQPQDAAVLLKSQLEEASSLSGDLSGKALSSSDKTKLDVYDQLFHALLSELALTPNVKTYLESIKLPLMALTLQDPEFLDSESHPARNLLNQLFSLDSAVTQNKVVKNTQIKQVLDQMMAKIAQGSITNPDIFAKANEELKEISTPITRSKDANIRRVVEVYEGKQKLEKARQKIQNAIDNRLAGKTVPNIVQSLLESGWQHLLVITELNDDTESRLRYFEVVDELLGWYKDLDKMPEGQFSIIEMELEFINNKLSTVCTNAFVHNKIMEELQATLIGIGTPRVRKPIDSAFVKPKAKAAPNEFVSDRWYLEVDQFEVGDWFTFSLEKESFEPLKLIWIGDLPHNYVFVNRDGYKKQDLTRNELAELLQSGVVTQIENLDEPVMDRATTTMLQQMQEKLIYSVSHDPVTSLPNRKRFVSLVKEQFAKSNFAHHVLGYLEIEDFRIITNVCGLLGGDQLLLQVAQLMGKQIGKDGLVSRLGDKTFGILMVNSSPEDAQETAKQLRDQINKQSFVWQDKSFTISVQIALVPVLDNIIHNVEDLLQKADSLIMSAKSGGHNRVRVYQENDESLKTQTDIHEWAGRIDRIFAENRLFARCQMIAPVFPEKNDHSHYEILLGVRGEDGKIIPPDNFIPAVESCQRMPEVDQWVVNNVFDWIVDNRRSFDKIGGFAINLSGQSLNSEEFLTFLKDRLSIQEVPPEKITFEVTETVAAGSLVFTKRFIKEIKQFGCKFSLDDFGTGYSSYSYLKSLDVDYLKIDGSFIKDIANSPTDQVMVNSMNEIAHSLELETIAEYVENTTILTILREIGVDYAQGWGIQKPIPLLELDKTLE